MLVGPTALGLLDTATDKIASAPFVLSETSLPLYAAVTSTSDSGFSVDVTRSGAISPLSPENILEKIKIASLDFSATRKSVPLRIISTGLPNIELGPEIARAIVTLPSAVAALFITKILPSVASDALPTSESTSLFVVSSKAIP